jgi:cytochrome c
LTILCVLSAPTALAQAPAAFAPCAACHSVDGASGLGPSLKGVMGRKAGAASGFTFSPAMKRSGITWDDKTLDAFLADPQKAVPGNTMPFPGVPDASQRTEIIKYLNTVK